MILTEVYLTAKKDNGKGIGKFEGELTLKKLRALLDLWEQWEKEEKVPTPPINK
jgi:predicted solute-binding protein